MGEAVLNQNKEQVNALNVFPVPDGDTGTNMGLTIKSAVKNWMNPWILKKFVPQSLVVL